MSISVVPQPVRLEETSEGVVLDDTTRIVAGAGTEQVVRTICAQLRPSTGLPLPVEAASAARTDQATEIRLALDPMLGASSYRLQVTQSGVDIDGGDPAGLFWGTQTLRQLLPPQVLRSIPVRGVAWRVAGVRIEDRPRFQWRGFMVDVSRHFFGREAVRKLIDTIALHRFNVLHLHLTDDQGWRLEIKRYPRLTEVGSWRAKSMLGPMREQQPGETRYDDVAHSGFFSQDDIRELVSYAADRFITIVPEIDVPGHSQAAIAAYPELGNLDEPLPVRSEWGVNHHILNVEPATVEFYRNVFAEVLELFPSTYVHVGGDEAPKDEWQASPRAQARIRELGLAGENGLQSWFIRQFDDFLTAHGRRLLGWDEILEGGLAPGATVVSWRSEDGGIAAAKAGHDVVMAPYNDTYFYLRQTDTPEFEPPGVGPTLSLRRVFDYEPVPAALDAEQATHVLGAQCQMWTEYVQSHRHLERMVFPRLCAFAERVWGSPIGQYAQFLDRMGPHLERLHALDLDVYPLADSAHD